MKKILSFLTLVLAPLALNAQSTPFTYQGLLNESGNAANGSYDLKFGLFDTPGGTNQIGGTLTNAATVVNNGLFTVMLDFGNQFPGASRWLEIAVRTNGNGGFGTLSPRQPLTPTPYAVTATSLIGLSMQQNASGAPNMTGGSPNNFVAHGVVGATIAGGGATNYAGDAYTNSVIGDFGTVGGGFNNTAGYEATIGGGIGNTSDVESAVGGGEGNSANGQWDVIGGGYLNTASGLAATVCGGLGNNATGRVSTVCGGDACVAGGDYSFAAGYFAKALHQGSFVWADNSQISSFSSTAPNQFCVRAAGGVRLAGDVQLDNATYHYLSLNGGNALGYLYGSFPKFADGVHLGYNFYADAGGNGRVPNSSFPTSRLTTGFGFVGIYIGGVGSQPDTERLYADSTGVRVDGTFNNNSDRNAKQDFASINPLQILENVTRLPLSEWSYKADALTRHLGPMAQDFYSTFHIGTDDKHIAPMDEGGVALAAIQGLNEKVEARREKTEARIQKLEEENARLKQKNESLEQRLDKLEGLLRDPKAR